MEKEKDHIINTDQGIFTTSKSALQILGKILQTENNDKWEKPKYIRTVVNQMRIRKTKYYKSQQSDKN